MWREWSPWNVVAKRRQWLRYALAFSPPAHSWRRTSFHNNSVLWTGLTTCWMKSGPVNSSSVRTALIIHFVIYKCSSKYRRGNIHSITLLCQSNKQIRSFVWSPGHWRDRKSSEQPRWCASWRLIAQGKVEVMFLVSAVEVRCMEATTIWMTDFKVCSIQNFNKQIVQKVALLELSCWGHCKNTAKCCIKHGSHPDEPWHSGSVTTEPNVDHLHCWLVEQPVEVCKGICQRVRSGMFVVKSEDTPAVGPCKKNSNCHEISELWIYINFNKFK